MFQKQTVFILGAGASNPYSYPLGSDLIKNIIKNIEEDVIFLPAFDNSGNGISFSEYDKINNPLKFSYFNEIYNKGNFKQFEIIKGFTKQDSKGDYLHTEKLSGRKYYQIKISNLEEFNKLKQALIDFDPVSIDAFLAHNPTHEKVGKIMIMYSLLKIENTTMGANIEDNWYSHLISDIFSGCKNPEQILENKLKMITFNYDMSLDYYLLQNISNTEFFKNMARKFVEELNIQHVYGQLYEANIEQQYGHYSGDSNHKNMQRFLYSLQNYEKIKTIGESRQEKANSVKKLISDAEEIIIIGFGFQRDNLSLLGFPAKREDYKEFLNGKTLKYMDYDGKMNSLYNQFTQLAQQHGSLITRSTSTEIVEAYQNDFKIYLY